ncbi:MAG: DNA topoisomerase VI subunit B [Candidatus Thermoplasmatota archaeon]|nr:DNA topoisomerase VI subunit B [Candidatus Thermoplasmatota archaeon]
MRSIVAEGLAKKQKDISVAEFFERNKQILGFDTSTRALITSVKEAVDNALDACEEATVLPDIFVKIQGGEDDEYRIVVEDNGPGIVKKQIPHVFARLLYGSRFHSYRQSRGQQGIGISAAVLYSQLTTGRPTVVVSKIGEGYPAHRLTLLIDTKQNRPEVVQEDMVHWERESGTRIELAMQGRYVRNTKHSVYEYLRSTAIVNPHAQITFVEPDGTRTVFERATDRLPPQPREIKPHPYGIELGTFMKMAKESTARKLSSFLSTEFSSVSQNKAEKIIQQAGLSPSDRPGKLSLDDGKKILKAFQGVKLMAPPTDCLSPIGELLIKRGLRKEMESLSPEFIATDKRSPAVFSGIPFLVETGIVYGGDLPAEERVDILRFANRVPLLYQEGDCAITETIKNIDWRIYGLQQRGGKGLPYGPAIILVHVASVNIPFTSESKEAIAHVEEIEKEIDLSLRQCARKMRSHLSKQEKRVKTRRKFVLISQILPQIAAKAAEVVGKPVPSIDEVIIKIMNIVWVDDRVSFDGGTVTSTIDIANYKDRTQSFQFYAALPDGGEVVSVSPEPAERNPRYLMWSISKLQPGEKRQLSFQLGGMAEGDFDENSLYVKGIDPVNVIGVEKWEGG